MTSLITVTTPWEDVVLICRKCGKKLDGGFGPKGRDTLSRILRDELRRVGRRRSVRIIETKCLKLCPKNAVTVLAGRTPGALLAVPAGAQATELLARLAPPA